MSAFSNKSIRYKFTVALVAVITVIVAVFSAALIMHNVRVIEAQLSQRLEESSNLATLSLSSALWQFNSGYVDDFVESLFLYEDIVFVTVYSGNEIVKKKVRQKNPGKDFSGIKASPDYISKETAIKHADQPIGKIQIALTRHKIRETIFNNVRNTILLLLLIVVAILLTNLIIMRYIIFNPLKRLEDSAIQISQGDLDTAIAISAKDEIGHLSEILNSMTRNLKKITASRDELNNEIDRRIRSEEALGISEANYRSIFDTANDAIFIHDLDTGKILDVNDKMCSMYGYTKEAALRIEVGELSEGKTPYTQKEATYWIKKATNGEPQIFQWKAKTKTNELFWVEVSLKLNRIGNEDRLMAIVRDITERKQSDDKIRASLQEKEILLKEVHHRVKNNMQIIQSLLNLQSGKIDDLDLKRAIQDSNNRIRSMALIHETLYRSGNFSHLNIEAYFQSIVKGLYRVYHDPEKNVDWRIEIDPVQLDMDKSIACGLIVNELVTNSLKYAFVNNKQGRIHIRLSQLNAHEAVLSVFDDGAGVPEGFNWHSIDSLGLQIVSMLSEDQLDGCLDLKNENGLAVTIQFPV